MWQALGAPEGIELMTWNTSALLSPSAKLRKRKGSFISRAGKNADILCLQEVRPDGASAPRLLLKLFPGKIAYISEHPESSTGGVVTMVSTKLAAKCVITKSIQVPGRVLRLAIAAGEYKLIVWNIHNFGISLVQFERMARRIKMDMKEHDLNPNKVLVTILGDMNFLSDGDTRCKAVDIATASNDGRRENWQFKYKALLRKTVEMLPSSPTHFHAASHSLARIDKIFLAVPSWALPSLETACSVKGDPLALQRCGISDHAPVSLRLGMRKQRPLEAQPISKHVLKSAAFAKHLAVITTETEVLELDPIPRWMMYKKNIKKAARNVRDEMLLADHRSHYAEEQLHMTIARMVWRQDVKLARRLHALPGLHLDC